MIAFLQIVSKHAVLIVFENPLPLSFLTQIQQLSKMQKKLSSAKQLRFYKDSITYILSTEQPHMKNYAFIPQQLHTA